MSLFFTSVVNLSIWRFRSTEQRHSSGLAFSRRLLRRQIKRRLSCLITTDSRRALRWCLSNRKKHLGCGRVVGNSRRTRSGYPRSPGQLQGRRLLLDTIRTFLVAVDGGRQQEVCLWHGHTRLLHRHRASLAVLLAADVQLRLVEHSAVEVPLQPLCGDLHGNCTSSTWKAENSDNEKVWIGCIVWDICTSCRL